MKQFYLFIILMLCYGVVDAQRYPSYPQQTAGIQLSVAGNRNYVLLLNGREYNLNGRYFEQNNLQSGRYPLQIGYYNGRYPYQRFIVVYNGFADLRPGFVLKAGISAGGFFNVWDYQPYFAQNCHQQAPAYPHQCPPVCPQPGYGYEPQTPPVIPFPGSGYGTQQYRQWMSNEAFLQWSDAVSRRSFDNDKLMVAKQGLNNIWVSASQIKQIMEMFSFESNRLEFAKYAWSFCGDQQQYYLVNDAFSFSGSIRELDNYISARR